MELINPTYGARPGATGDAPMHVEREPAKLSLRVDVPAQVEHALRRGLAEQPPERHADMEALNDQLEDALQWGAT